MLVRERVIGVARLALPRNARQSAFGASAPLSGPAQKLPGGGDVEQIPRKTVDECGVIGTGDVEYLPRHPAAERHAEQREHQHWAARGAAPPGRKTLGSDVPHCG